MRQTNRITFFATLLSLVACAGKVPHPTPLHVQRAQQRWPGLTREDLEVGRTLYLSKCSGCHTLVLPARLIAERWPPILDKMKKLAKLSDPEKEQVLHYILAIKMNEEETKR